MDGDGGDLAEFGKTSRERPKSVPYLRLKIAKGLQSAKYSLLQYPHEEKVEKIPFFRSFFHFFSSPISRIVPKNVERDIKKA